MCQRFMKYFTNKVIKHVEEEEIYVLIYNKSPDVILQFRSTKENLNVNFAKNFTFKEHPTGELIYKIYSDCKCLFTSKIHKLFESEGSYIIYDYNDISYNEMEIIEEFMKKRLEIFRHIDDKYGLLNYFNGIEGLFLIKLKTGI